MCTAISFKSGGAFFGRNLDLEYHYNENVVITPRNFSLEFRKTPEIKKHYAIIGMAYISEGYPLYYDAMNEKGLFAAGLNFPENAIYLSEKDSFRNVAPFELIPYILAQCATAAEAKSLLEKTNIINAHFSEKLLNTPLHWFCSDGESSIVIEPSGEGLRVYDDPFGVLTNNPPFEFQMQNLSNYLGLSPKEPLCTFAEGAKLEPYSRGMGAIGLPGDLSSSSRFVRAAFVKLNSVCESSEEESITQFFHILGAVEQQKGAVRLENGGLERTVYSSCISAGTGTYYYRTYENSRICGVCMNKENLCGEALMRYPLESKQDILFQN